MKMITLKASRDMERGDAVNLSGGYFVCLNTVRTGESFYAFLRRGIEPLPNPGLPPRHSLVRRLWIKLLVRWDMVTNA